MRFGKIVSHTNYISPTSVPRMAFLKYKTIFFSKIVSLYNDVKIIKNKKSKIVGLRGSSRPFRKHLSGKKIQNLKFLSHSAPPFSLANSSPQ